MPQVETGIEAFLRENRLKYQVTDVLIPEQCALVIDKHSNELLHVAINTDGTVEITEMEK